MFYKLLLSLTFIALFIVQDVFSQVEVELDSIAVTASRISSTVSESGKNVSVITRRDIDQMPVTSVDDLLRSLPGVNINARQGFGVQADVGVRGSTFSQVLFMLDNVPLNDPLTAHFNTNIPVSLSEIGQIELVRGPASASFGADAVGGVIHIKTRSYLERELSRSDQLQTRVSADLGAGQHNLQLGDIAVDLQQNRWRFSTSLRHVSSDGEELDNPGFDAGASDQPTYNNYFNLTTFTSSLSYRLSDHLTIYTRGGIEERDFSARYFYTRSEFDQSEEQIGSRWGLAAITHDRNAHRSELNFSYRNVEDTFDFMPGAIPPNDHTTDQIFVNLSHQYELQSDAISNRFNYIRLMAGAQYLNKQIESTDRGNHQTDMGGIYAIGSFSWLNGFNVTASARIQFDSNVPAEFLPQLSASYTAGTVTLRSSAGRAIRVGDFTERYISSQIPDLQPLRNIGNPDLRPERSFTIDGGLDWRPRSTVKISPTVFYRSSSNLIDYALVNSNQITNADNLQPDELYFYASNIEQSSVVGVEFLSDLTHNLNQNRAIGLQAGYTFIRTTSDGDDPSKYIANHPSHQVNFGLRYTARWISFHSENSYHVRSEESDQIIDGDVPSAYFLSNLKIEAQTGWSPSTVYLRVMNLTDTEYQEILGAPMPRRWIMAGLKLQF
ncbi:TonB-dependent receptor [Rhodohalobacter sp. SW132]|uniref:TonB-dependent receptor plug domain-containing protein n=1 Tax=Rhodohalobacter sp. SW132 TaxID=2293433 RepID=UPI000E26A9ED|nr:TonB-dependent receptor [Rhodohalobacter sp. SW132]REL24459.1 TonB-dependent receptor [Rhodohalobacter sp. SW132]